MGDSTHCITHVGNTNRLALCSFCNYRYALSAYHMIIWLNANLLQRDVCTVPCHGTDIAAMHARSVSALCTHSLGAIARRRWPNIHHTMRVATYRSNSRSLFRIYKIKRYFFAKLTTISGLSVRWNEKMGRSNQPIQLPRLFYIRSWSTCIKNSCISYANACSFCDLWRVCYRYIIEFHAKWLVMGDGGGAMFDLVFNADMLHTDDVIGEMMVMMVSLALYRIVW